jgi:hypothetical protein
MVSHRRSIARSATRLSKGRHDRKSRHAKVATRHLRRYDPCRLLGLLSRQVLLASRPNDSGAHCGTRTRNAWRSSVRGRSEFQRRPRAIVRSSPTAPAALAPATMCGEEHPRGAGSRVSAPLLRPQRQAQAEPPTNRRECSVAESVAGLVTVAMAVVAAEAMGLVAGSVAVGSEAGVVAGQATGATAGRCTCTCASFATRRQ